jgi:hypothetical protein
MRTAREGRVTYTFAGTDLVGETPQCPTLGDVTAAIMIAPGARGHGRVRCGARTIADLDRLWQE